MPKQSVPHLEQYQWKKGQSGNPSGKKKGLAVAAREAVGEDGIALAQLWWEIATDETQRSSDRLEATRLLADRGWGKAATFTAQEGDPLGLADMEQAAEEFRRNIIRLASSADERSSDRPGDEPEPDKP